MRILDTPLGVELPAIASRPGGPSVASLIPAFLERPGLESTLERLRTGGTLMVTTGQQPGLFTGPLYTVYKALSAAALAAALEARWQRPVVPVFWLAGDDHDYEEARHAAWLDADGILRRASLPEREQDALMVPMSDLLLDEEIERRLGEFEASFPESGSRDLTMRWLRRHYRPGRSIAEAFGEAMADLLAPFGVVCFDSTHPAAKRAMSPILLAALEQSEALDDLLLTRNRQLSEAGRPSGVTVAGDQALVFLVEPDAGRDRLVQAPDGDGFQTRRTGRPHSSQALRGLLRERPELFSPNVVLRPVVESALLPTVAYVAGPGELGYLPLSEPVYRALNVPRQVPVPRWSGLLVEPRVDRVLERFGTTLDELMDDAAALERRVVRTRMPPEVDAAADRLARALETEYDALLAEAVAIDPTLERPVAARRRDAERGLDRVVRKIERHLRTRAETELRQITGARASVRPGGRPQERVLTAAGFLARYGPGFLASVRARAEAWYRSALEEASTPS